MKEKNVKPKVLLWDIESTNLAANFGYIICIGYKWLGEKKVHLISIRDFKDAFKKDCTNDKEVVKAFAKVMAEADVQVAHYGAKFDLPMVQTRLMMHGLEPLTDVPMIDTWRIAKYKMKFNSNRLETISHAVPVKGKRELKTPVAGHHWVRAMAGYVPSIKYVETHCIADIKVLENAYLTLRKYASGLPNLAILKGRPGCPACGSERVVSNGARATVTGKKLRWRCQECGHNHTTTMPKNTQKAG